MRQVLHVPRVTDRPIETDDRRIILVREGGDAAGRAVLVHLGTPNSRILHAPHLQDAAERGIRLLSDDRPGYGSSSPQPGRAIVDCVGDVRAIIDALEINRLAVWGVSGGGPHALACLSRLPDRVVAATTLASTAPFDAEGLD
jgi:pimeloyl-ACP methyl ester carboxylesterase